MIDTITGFHKDTKISLMDGREITLELAQEEFKDSKFWIYSCNENQDIVPAKANIIISPTTEETISITLDNDETIICSKNQNFVMRNGEYKLAKDLVENDSLMPIYREKSNTKEMKGYDKFLNPRNQKWYYTHRKNVTAIQGKYKGVVHHKDFNKTNNNPENLEVMTWEAHTELHMHEQKKLLSYSKSPEGRQKSRDLMNKLWADPVWAAASRKRIPDNGKKVSKILVAEGRCGFQAMDKDKLREIARKTGHMIWEQNLRSEESQKKALNSRNERLKNDPEFKKKMGEIAKANLKEYNEDPNKIVTEKQRAARANNGKMNMLRYTYNKHYKNQFATFEEYVQFRPKKNHKVKAVAIGDSEVLYNLIVEGSRNFAVSAGVFVNYEG